jgi:inner membrane protein
LLAALAFSAILLAALGFAGHRLRKSFAGGVGLHAEIALSPYPANPLCWLALTAEIQGEEYIATAYTAAPFPSLLPAAHCPPAWSTVTEAPLQPVRGARPSAERIPLGEFRRPSRELAALAQSCRARAFLRFARIPLWANSGKDKFIGDLRFSRGRSLGFSDIRFGEEGEKCPSGEAPWIGRFFRDLPEHP